MSAPSLSHGYFLAGAEELERLELQAGVWEPEADAMLERIGVAPGWSCADLGCGAVGILGPLYRRTGQLGRVIGLDADCSLLNAARAYVQREGLSNIELVEGDVGATGLPQASFDLVHARFLLPHVESPEGVLREMIALAKPGGTIALQENDHSSWNFHPPCPAWSRLLSLLEQTFALKGDINIGRRTFHMLKSAGLEDVQVRAAVLALQDCHPYMRMPLIGARAMRGRLIASGLTDEKEFEELTQAVEQAANDPDRVQVTFTLIQAWGRKPAAVGWAE